MKTVHAEVKSFQCQLCFQSFVIKSDLDRHMKVKCFTKLKTKLGLMKLEEPFLNSAKSSVSKSLINNISALSEFRNIKTQPEEDGIIKQLYWYQCDVCEKTFSDVKSLEAHFKQDHNSNKAFACKACNTRFPKEDILTKHLQGCK